MSENISKNTISSPSHNTSLIQPHRNENIKASVNTPPSINTNNFYSPRNNGLHVPPPIQGPKPLSSPTTPENKRDFYRPFLSGNMEN